MAGVQTFDPNKYSANYQAGKTYRSPDAATYNQQIAPLNAALQNPSNRNLGANFQSALDSFNRGQGSLEDVMSAINGSTPFDPSKGPQIDYGQGPQALSPAQLGALAQGKDIKQIADEGAPQGIKDQFQAQTNQLISESQARAAQYQQAHQLTQGKTAPQDGSGVAAAAALVPPPKQNQVENLQQQAQMNTTPNVDLHFTGNQLVQDSTQSLMEFLSPQATKDDIFNQMKTIIGQQNQLAGEKAQLMNINRIMSGTQDDIRSEIQAANGFATDSQVQALAIGRNKTLLKQAQLIQDQITTQQDLIANNQNLLNFEKDMANQQFTQRMGILNYQQQNQSFMYNAAKDSANTLKDALGFDGMYAATKNDPIQLMATASHYGMTVPEFQQAATQAAQKRALETQKATLENQKLITESAAGAAVDPETLQGMLNVFKSTGNVPAMGMSGKTPLRAQFYKALGTPEGAQIVSDAATNKAVRQGIQTAMSTQQNQLAANKTAIATLDKQLQLAQQYSDKISRSNSPFIAKYQLAAKSGVFGDPDTAAFNNIVKTASNEFAKILSGSAASISGVTVSSAADAENLLNSAMSKGQFTAVISLMQKEAQYRLQAQQDTINQLLSDSQNVAGLSSSLKTTQGGATEGQTQTYQGATYKVINKQWVKQ